MRTCVIFNPAAKGDKARHFRAHLGEISREAALRQTQRAGHATALAAAAVGEGFETIVAAGGDGTLNETLNGLAQAPGGLERARLGVIPLGTVNVFARELGLPLSFEGGWRAIRAGRERRMDLPVAEFEQGGRRAARCFLQLGGAGLDSRAIELVNWGLKRKVGPLAYVWAGLKAICGRLPPVEVEAGEGHPLPAGELVLLGNGRLYGGHFALFPAADLADGLLDVCVFPRARLGTLLRCGPGLLLKRRVPESVVRRGRAGTLTLRSRDRASFELDGELVGQLPVTVRVQREALRVVVPEG